MFQYVDFSEHIAGTVWTIENVLEYLDGNGLIITDGDLIIESLSEIGVAIFDTELNKDK